MTTLVINSLQQGRTSMGTSLTRRARDGRLWPRSMLVRAAAGQARCSCENDVDAHEKRRLRTGHRPDVCIAITHSWSSTLDSQPRGRSVLERGLTAAARPCENPPRGGKLLSISGARCVLMPLDLSQQSKWPSSDARGRLTNSPLRWPAVQRCLSLPIKNLSMQRTEETGSRAAAKQDGSQIRRPGGAMPL